MYTYLITDVRTILSPDQRTYRLFLTENVLFFDQLNQISYKPSNNKNIKQNRVTTHMGVIVDDD